MIKISRVQNTDFTGFTFSKGKSKRIRGHRKFLYQLNI